MLTSDNLNNRLLAGFPDLGPEADRLRRWNVEPGEPLGSHVLFEDAFVPYIMDCVTTSDATLNLSEACKFLEEMATSSDDEVQTVLVVSVLEALLAQTAVRSRERLLAAVGPLTLQLARKCITY